MTTILFYEVVGIDDKWNPNWQTVEREYNPTAGTRDKAIEIHKNEIKMLQEVNGWTQVEVNYRGYFSK